jgi:hypothetical protein
LPTVDSAEPTLYQIYDGADFGLYYLRVAPRGKRPIVRYPAETLTLMLHREAAFKRSAPAPAGRRTRTQFQRGDIDLYAADQIAGGVVVGSSSTFDALLIAVPAGTPSVQTSAARSDKRPGVRYLFAAARAKVDAQKGPIRQARVMHSAHVDVELLRVTGNASLKVDAGRGILFPAQGGATISEGAQSEPFAGNSVYLIQAGEKFRLLPARRKPLYLLMITIGG